MCVLERAITITYRQTLEFTVGELVDRNMEVTGKAGDRPHRERYGHGAVPYRRLHHSLSDGLHGTSHS